MRRARRSPGRASARPSAKGRACRRLSSDCGRSSGGPGFWSLVSGPWSRVPGWWSLVRGPRLPVHGSRLPVRGWWDGSCGASAAWIYVLDAAQDVLDAEQWPDTEAGVVVADAADGVDWHAAANRELDVLDHLAGVQLEHCDRLGSFCGARDHLRGEGPQGDRSDKPNAQALGTRQTHCVLHKAP